MGRGNEYRGRESRGRNWDDQPSDAGYSKPAFGGGAPAGGARPYSAPRRDAAPVEGTPATGKVKWYKADKGFGFVELSDGTGDVFLHARALEASGHDQVPPGTTLQMTVAPGQKGRQVVSVTGVDVSTAEAQRGGGMGGGRPSGGFDAPTERLDGVVKWYDDNKGFGFVQANDGGKDVFVHANSLRDAGITYLAEGQRVGMDVRVTPKGREAAKVYVS